MKRLHEIRDPIHTFVRLDSDEREVLDSRPVQRLRHIHQLALTSLVYPGATHKRFEHSLGVMELATRIFDTVTCNLDHQVARDLVPPDDQRKYWRRVLRMAALCHDIGHLPFSHAAEKDLLPEGWNHERITVELIRSDDMEAIWSSLTPPLTSEHIVKLAVGAKELPDTEFDDWQTILAEIIVGDAFGADRMDYLLRDSHHAGVAYGGFDHHRLIDTLRILPQTTEDSAEPALGIEEGGLHSAEALLLARYFMYTQIYFHPVRRIYDRHLKDFLYEWRGGEGLPVEVEQHLALTDHEVYAGMLEAARIPSAPGHEAARRIVEHDHFREVYRRTRADVKRNPAAAALLGEALEEEFGSDAIVRDPYRGTGGAPDFPVVMPDGTIVSSMDQSDVLETIPPVAVDFIFAAPQIREDVSGWLSQNRERIVPPVVKDEQGEWP